MTKNTLLRLSAVAAIVGGVLRVADAFMAAAVAVHIQQGAYFVIDLMLLFGLCGIYLSRSNRLGWAGLIGFVASVTGILMVRGSVLSLFGLSAYLIGATVTLVGVVAIGTSMLIHAAFPKLAPILWIASLIIGLIGLLFPAMSWGVLLAGVTFATGFIVAGINLFSGTSAGVT